MYQRMCTYILKPRILSDFSVFHKNQIKNVSRRKLWVVEANFHLKEIHMFRKFHDCRSKGSGDMLVQS